MTFGMELVSVYKLEGVIIPGKSFLEGQGLGATSTRTSWLVV